jgi:hypothetical protein
MGWGPDCDDAVSQPRFYFSPRNSDVLINAGVTTILSIVVDVPEGSWGLIAVGTGSVDTSAGGTGSYVVRISDSVAGLLTDNSSNQPASTTVSFSIQGSLNNLGPGTRTLTLEAADVGGAGTATCGSAQFMVMLVPASSLTLAATI